ncbi:hypothetical protein RND71_022504 [Anisodus tanguticus]|uniref:Large ribosomal subunit protein uL11 C-terminal domain-containing protein n=1 Tax=Anisodus tanguticus TaxID=243964 RepID=A0AAE1RQT5_9SOLA|nr:hypothetical protein RND71_022504 [Anisodus tanguticus]
MSSKFDPSQVVKVFIRVTGGEVVAASSLKGPMCHPKVFIVPSAAALVIKALKKPERDRKKTKNIKHNGNISLDDVIEIAKIMALRSIMKDLSGTMKENDMSGKLRTGGVIGRWITTEWTLRSGGTDGGSRYSGSSDHDSNGFCQCSGGGSWWPTAANREKTYQIAGEAAGEVVSFILSVIPPDLHCLLHPLRCTIRSLRRGRWRGVFFNPLCAPVDIHREVAREVASVISPMYHRISFILFIVLPDFHWRDRLRSKEEQGIDT